MRISGSVIICAILLYILCAFNVNATFGVKNAQQVAENVAVRAGEGVEVLREHLSESYAFVKEKFDPTFHTLVEETKGQRAHAEASETVRSPLGITNDDEKLRKMKFEGEQFKSIEGQVGMREHVIAAKEHVKEGIKEGVQDTKNYLKEKFVEAPREGWQETKARVEDSVQSLKENVADKVHMAGQTAAQRAELARERNAQAAEDLKSTISRGAEYAKEKLSDLGTGIKQGLSSTGEKVADTVRSAEHEAEHRAELAKERNVHAARNLKSTLQHGADYLSGKARSVEHAAEERAELARERNARAAEDLKSSVQHGAEYVREQGRAMKEGVKQSVDELKHQMYHQGVEKPADALHKAQEKAHDVKEDVKVRMARTADEAQRGFQRQVNRAKETVTAPVRDVKSGMETSIERLEEAMARHLNQKELESDRTPGLAQSVYETARSAAETAGVKVQGTLDTTTETVREHEIESHLKKAERCINCAAKEVHQAEEICEGSHCPPRRV